MVDGGCVCPAAAVTGQSGIRGGGGVRKKAEERGRGRKGGRSRAQAGAEQGSAEGAEEGSAVRRGGGWHSEERDTQRERVGPIHLTPRAAYQHIAYSGKYFGNGSGHTAMSHSWWAPTGPQRQTKLGGTTAARCSSYPVPTEKRGTSTERARARKRERDAYQWQYVGMSGFGWVETSKRTAPQ